VSKGIEHFVLVQNVTGSYKGAVQLRQCAFGSLGTGHCWIMVVYKQYNDEPGRDCAHIRGAMLFTMSRLLALFALILSVDAGAFNSANVKSIPASNFKTAVLDTEVCVAYYLLLLSTKICNCIHVFVYSLLLVKSNSSPSSHARLYYEMCRLIEYY